MSDASPTVQPLVAQLQGKRTYLFLLGLLFPPLSGLLSKLLHLNDGAIKGLLDYLSSEDGYQLCTLIFGTLAAWARNRVGKPLLSLR